MAKLVRSSAGATCAHYAARGNASLFWIFPAIAGANGAPENEICHIEQSRDIPRSYPKHFATGFLDFARNDRYELAAEMITAPLLEIAVLVLGMVILMIEAFAGKIDKRVLAFAAITGLAIVLLASFFVARSPSPSYATGFWSFTQRIGWQSSSSNSRC